MIEFEFEFDQRIKSAARRLRLYKYYLKRLSYYRKNLKPFPAWVIRLRTSFELTIAIEEIIDIVDTYSFFTLTSEKYTIHELKTEYLTPRDLVKIPNTDPHDSDWYLWYIELQNKNEKVCFSFYVE